MGSVMALNEYLRDEVVEDFADGLLSRREALRRLGLLGVGAVTATGLLAACGGDDDDADPSATAAGAPTSAAATAGASGAPGAGTADGEAITFAGPAGQLLAAWAPAGSAKAGVLVIHENRGLTPHFFDLVGRLAAAGYSALAVDLVSREGGTATLGDEAKVQEALNNASADRLMADLKAAVDELEKRVPGKRVGTMGFCFGGGMVWQLLHTGEPRLAAAVPFYGPAPDAPDFSRSKAAVLGIYGELDGDRVNGKRAAAEAALKKAGLPHQIKTYAGANHAFFNDTGARYHEPSATQAYADVLAWFAQHLD